MGKKKSKANSGAHVKVSASAGGSASKSQMKKKNQHPNINLKRLKNVLSKQKALPVPVAKVEPPQPSKKNQPKKSLAEDARERLESGHFRYLNEQLYTSQSSDAVALFKEDPQSFEVYHKGFQNQVAKWPVNPLDVIIADLQKRPRDWVIADFGCGEARLALSLSNRTVHSFDLVAANERVTACDMANVPLPNRTADVAVFCLSLMGKNLGDFLKEANRVLKIGGLMYLAEVESRCPNIVGFLKSTEKFGFKLKEQDSTTYRYFFLAKFTKTGNISPKATLPRMHLKPCLYKKR